MRRKIPPALTLKQIEEIIQAILSKPVKGQFRSFIKLRNGFMIYFGFYMQGLRPSEIFKAQVFDLDLKNKRFYIRGENNKLRQQDYSPIPDFFVSKIKSYLKQRDKIFPYSKWLFPCKSKRGCLDRSDFGKMFREALKKAGLYRVNFVDKQGLKRACYNPYSIRHGFGTFAFKKTGYDLRKTQILMRHKSMRSTLVYTHIPEFEIREAVVSDIFKPNDLGLLKKRIGLLNVN